MMIHAASSSACCPAIREQPNRSGEEVRPIPPLQRDRAIRVNSKPAPAALPVLLDAIRARQADRGQPDRISPHPATGANGAGKRFAR